MRKDTISAPKSSTQLVLLGLVKMSVAVGDWMKFPGGTFVDIYTNISSKSESGKDCKLVLFQELE
ncbi:hypothetical protein C5167_040137 [Papaver somniferum]|uniref:Uncharacterized protein n=1 Tax=Papaver somniferum TaxID=3469 RepID=A0A4Y7IIB7_PAPSO|nr:hypothetical protein C5167_040137 [Papaver somniferum]